MTNADCAEEPVRTEIDYDPDDRDRITNNIIYAFDEGTIKRHHKSAIISDQPIFV
jgi:hypothetical protein